jgi:hypothetical protein
MPSESNIHDLPRVIRETSGYFELCQREIASSNNERFPRNDIVP